MIIYDPVLLSAPVPLAPESEQGMSFTPEPDEPTPQTEDHQDNSATTTAAAPELPESCDTAPKRGRGRAKRGKKGRVAAGEELPAAGCPASSTEADRLAERTAAAWARTKRRQESKKEKKKEKKARSGIPPAHRLTFVRRAAPGVRSAQFAAPEAMHSDEGYLGRDDKRRQYNLASGSAAEILERLGDFGYEVVDLESRRVCSSNLSSGAHFTALATTTRSWTAWAESTESSLAGRRTGIRPGTEWSWPWKPCRRNSGGLRYRTTAGATLSPTPQGFPSEAARR